MALIHMVRHGKAAAGIGENPDPSLDATGRAQAEQTCSQLARLNPIRIVSSPLARAQETAVPLAEHWQAPVDIERCVAEIPFANDDLAARASWLAEVMPGRWRDLDDALKAWRQALIDWALSQEEDVIAFSHFIAINVLVGAAEDDDRMVVFRPDNASVTTLSNDGGRLTVVSKGDEAETKVN